ncbi:MAG: hypothetical protein Q9220_007364 [cf. Caloplaca sp. 1 TL-2023]
MRKRQVLFPWYRRRHIRGSSPSSASDDESEIQDPEFREFVHEHPGGRTYNAANAAEFEDVRGEILSDEHIRLVRVSSLDGGGRRLLLQWQQVPLQFADEYNVLSYTWGAPSADPLSNIKGYRLTPNLVSCLAVLMIQAPGLWWIDALCIDQDNLDEKDQQVKKMRDIYARAQKLYVWLGPESSDGLAGLHILVKICDLSSQGKVDQGGPPLDFDDDELQSVGLPETTSPIWRAFLVFLSRPYFSRMWVLQELAVATEDTSIVCGEHILSYQVLYYALHFMDRQGWRATLSNLAGSYNVDTSLPAFHFVDTVTLFRVHLQHNDQRSLLFYLDMSRTYRSSDPRDKIIALLGIISPDERVIKELEPNYSQPVADYFRQVTGALIMHHRSYHVLTMVEARSPADDESLPSWVPNYSKEWHNPFHALQFIESPGTPFGGKWISGSNSISIEASILDEIDKISSESGAIDANMSATIMSWLSMAAEAVDSDAWLWLASAVNPQDPTSWQVDTFWRTLIGNQWNHEDGMRRNGAPESGLYLFLGNLLRHFAQSQENKKNTIILMDSWKRHINVQRLIITPLILGETEKYQRLVFDSCAYKTFFITTAGRMGLGPWTLHSGDEVATFAGGNSLYFLRQSASKRRFVGHGYVHDLMTDCRSDTERVYSPMGLE